MAAFILSTLHASTPYANDILTALAIGFTALAGGFAVGPALHHVYGEV